MSEDGKNELSRYEEFLSNISESRIGKVFKLVSEGIPYVNAVYSGIIGNIEKKKLIIFLQGWFKNELDSKLEENNEEQTELITHAVLKSIRCSKDGQVRQIVSILKGTFDGKISSFDDAEDLINIVGELSENEACQLRQIYLMFNAKDQKNTTDIIYLNRLRGNNCEFLCSRLVGKGLLADASLSYSAPHKSYQPPNITGEKLYKATHMGDCLFKSLKLFRE